MLVVMSFLLLCAGCQRFEWRRDGEVFHAAERGRLVTLRQVSILDHQRLTNWHSVLVEDCTDLTVHETDPPCFPMNGIVPQSLLEQLYDGSPDFREPVLLLGGAQYFNRGIGTFIQSWVVGTSPLAIAFLDADASAEKYSALASSPAHPTTGPGLEVVARAGKVLGVKDNRFRDAHLVTEDYLDRPVNVLLLYPVNMAVESGVPLDDPYRTTPLTLKIIIFRKPLSVERLIQYVADPSQFANAQIDVVTAPVRGN